MKKSKLHGVLRIAVLVLAGILLGLGIYNFNAQLLVGDPMPMPLGIGASVVLSGSMEPELSIDDMIIVKKTDHFYKDQVVVFRDGDGLTVHRILEVGEDTVTTMGDANNTADAPIKKSDIKGEVIFVIPGFGAVFAVLRHPAVILAVAVLAIVLFELSFKREKKDDQTELDRLREQIEQLSGELTPPPDASADTDSTFEESETLDDELNNQ